MVVLNGPCGGPCIYRAFLCYNFFMGKTALLVIDVINSCCHERCETPEYGITFSKIRKMVPVLKDFIQEYQKKDLGPVFYTKTVPWKEEYLPDNINNLYADPEKVYYSEDVTGFAEEFYLLEPGNKDTIITKNTYDAFTDTALNKKLKDEGAENVLVAGVFGDGCVLATIAGGFSLGYNFVILKDLIETTDKKERQELLSSLRSYTFPMMYGETVDSEEYLEKVKKEQA
jgi:nicotinamidase-related amidase